MNRIGLASLCALGAVLLPRAAAATKSAELYTDAAYLYGRFETRMRFTAGDGVVSAYFLWKDGSEVAGTFWNELDYEKIGATCEFKTNALYGNPGENHTTAPTLSGDVCSGFRVYSYEWTPDYIAWFVDGTEVRRETGATATAFRENASAGMQFHFNIWPGDETFGGNFDPSILPVHQYVDWVQYSTWAAGTFTVAWREDFGGSTLPSEWLTGNWGSPKNLSTHDPLNVNFLGGCAVLSMTADGATGPTGAMPEAIGCTGAMAGAGGAGGMTGMAGASAGGAAGTGATAGGSAGTVAAGGMSASGAAGGMPGAGGMAALGGSSGTTATTGGVSGGGAVSASGGAGAAFGGSSGTTSSMGAQAGVGGAAAGTSSVGGSSTAGVGGTGGAQATPESPKPDETTGCGCRVPGMASGSQHAPGIGAALLLALAYAFRRRRA
jgi:endo-1,3-1,4-beta-glycanase ExoK